MTTKEGLFSLRIVVADFYMCRPTPELDPTYSEFRAHEIKTLPIIRVFGSNTNGEKTCMHVHGVFPYFYIPYEENESNDPQQLIYQIATSLDKAINVSLGQTRSQNQHVFKIQLVKGIPFYGYHRKEHQFFKIYLYNPRFIKKAANFFQNGAILGRMFQPHESHVPYMLQFFIDYNLYGMSLLHVPMEIIKYRQGDGKGILPELDQDQILDVSVARISTSRHEIDVAAVFILNRFQLLSKGSGNTNPGIESIWQDERVRRSNLPEEQEAPSLEIPYTQDRLLAKPTESDLFYKSALRSKMLDPGDLDNSFNSTVVGNTEQKKSRFNLSKFLANSVYPSECSQESNELLINASKIDDHLSSDNTFHSSVRTRSLSSSVSVVRKSIDESFVDEDMVFSLSQPKQNALSQTLLGEDFELLEVMQQLEEDQGEIDMDSTLAPLSQTTKYVLNEVDENILNVTVAQDQNRTCSDEEEDLNDYTMSVESVDKILLELSQQQTIDTPARSFIPQLDGADDSLLTPKKRRTTRAKTLKSPRTPKVSSASKYTPLNITINKSPSRIPMSLREGGAGLGALSSASKDQEDFLPNGRGLKRKRVLVNLSKEFNTLNNNNKTTNGYVNSLENKSFITCNLKPRKARVRLLKLSTPIRKIEKTESIKAGGITKDCLKRCAIKIKRVRIDKTLGGLIEKETKSTESPIERSHVISLTDPVSPVELGNKTEKSSIIVIHDSESCSENIDNCKEVEKLTQASDGNKESILDEDKEFTRGIADKCTDDHHSSNIQQEAKQSNACDKKNELNLNDKDSTSVFVDKSIEEHSDVPDNESVRLRAVETTPEAPRNRRRSWSPCDLAREFDRINNYYPTAGPSGLKKGREKAPKISKTPAKSISTIRTRSSAKQVTAEDIYESDSHAEPNNDLSICSFYEKSFLIDSPSLFSDCSPRTPSLKGDLKLILSNESQIQSIHTQLLSELLVVITPKDLPPTFDEVEKNLIAFNIPDEIYTEPFYGDDSDVTSRKEIGHTILRIPGKSLNACEKFVSLMPDANGISTWRKNLLSVMLGGSVSGELQTTASIKEYFSSRDKTIISTRNIAPSKLEAIQWLEDQCRAHSPRNSKQIDSPIKVKREKIKLVLDETTNSIDSGNCDTPDSVKTNESNRLNDTLPKTPLSALQKFRERRKSRARLSLMKKLQRLNSTQSETDTEKKCTAIKTNGKIQCVPVVNLVEDSEDSEKMSDESSVNSSAQDLCSNKIRQILERTSFIKKLTITENDGGHDISFGLTGASPNNTFGFKISLENLQNVKADVEYNYLTVFSLELCVRTRDDLKPDPEHDPVECLFFSITSNAPATDDCPIKTSGCIMITDGNNPSLNGLKTRIIVVKTELELLDELLKLCELWDPDILAGYEIEMNSWGYLMDRAQFLGINLKAQLSRVPSHKVRDSAAADEEIGEHFSDFDIDLKLCGRILLDVWRLMRSEIALTSYTFENVVYHILHRRCPLHSFKELTKWYSVPNTRWIVMEYYLERVNGTLELLDQLDLIGRTSEMAKLIGIQFYEVLSRGSQFRVESMMLRIAKPKNLVPVSPSVQQRAHMRAPEYLSLILEPQSRFYSDPMIVLDFQSLYPSIIIAYNYCFSTCLGRVEHLGQSTPFEFGASQLRVSRKELERLIDNDLITISPCGVAFVKKEVREGILPRMLKEILDTRQMVKQSMKVHKTNSTLQRVLHSRQLGLKLMANVTYGYTAANFSGRMPSVEVGDSVVSKGRETLERAIKLVEANKEWRVKVVYGDTDSLFVLVPGRSRADAFKIGEEIVEAVTNDNPQPVKLKLEKVYSPCILQTKKRYVGYMYETVDQEKPVYEAKGIETVRRDGCPAVAKMLEKCLRILFETCDVSEIKRYVCRQFTKLLTGKANVQDLIFAKEFRGKGGYKPGACVPALELTRKWLQTDRRNEPRRGERVPYLIVNGPPGLPLIRLVRSPHDFLADEGLKINSIYYITKAIIPPLNRCLLLIGANVNDWFADLPRKHLALPTVAIADETNNYQSSKKSTISQYFSSTNCVVDCGRHTTSGICNNCLKNPHKGTVLLSQKISKLERSYFLTKKICQSCCGRSDNLNCQSLDCPVLFVANLKKRDQSQIQYLRKLIADNFS